MTRDSGPVSSLSLDASSVVPPTLSSNDLIRFLMILRLFGESPFILEVILARAAAPSLEMAPSATATIENELPESLRSEIEEATASTS